MASILNRIPTTQSYLIQNLPRQKSSFQTIRQKIQNKIENEKKSTIYKILQNYKNQTQVYTTPSKKPKELIGKNKTAKIEKKSLSFNSQTRTKSIQNRKQYSNVSTITIKIAQFDMEPGIQSIMCKEPKIYEIQLDQFN
ncbi:unnamed protein product [Paramecium sonneborni]|uniref:Uncharacterized protein n=1 Tax=Paramecium sonneborni TaxID=65129 RepID=A0A8S1R9L6_9CILI|nr:unnamed protein product [Paramecium sonneborni]